tara:strand:+ start:114 stop:440 length:327 start_codon:yes stop_codon:yes gene_type:complete
VCSTSNEKAVKEIVKTMLPEFADRIPVFAGDVVAKKKPAPDVYNLAATTLGVNPARCVVIEDTRIGEYIFTFTFTFNSYFHIGNQLDTDVVFCVQGCWREKRRACACA